MFVRPAPCAYVTPQLRLYGRDDAHTDSTLLVGGGSLNRPAKYITYLDRSVVASTEHSQRSDTRERTHLVEYRCSAVEKKALDHAQRGRAQFLEYTESKSLSDGRLDSVEDGICASTFHPFGTAVRE